MHYQLFAARALAALLSMAAALATAAVPTLVPSQFSDGTQVDTEVLGTRIPLLLVHGLGGGPTGWEEFLRAYQQNPNWRSAFKPYSDWAEQAFPVYLLPSGALTAISAGYYFRYYPSTQAYLGVKSGNVYYLGPPSGNRIRCIGSLADFLAQAQAAGF